MRWSCCSKTTQVWTESACIYPTCISWLLLCKVNSVPNMTNLNRGSIFKSQIKLLKLIIPLISKRFLSSCPLCWMLQIWKPAVSRRLLEVQSWQELEQILWLNVQWKVSKDCTEVPCNVGIGSLPYTLKEITSEGRKSLIISHFLLGMSPTPVLFLFCLSL